MRQQFVSPLFLRHFYEEGKQITKKTLHAVGVMYFVEKTAFFTSIFFAAGFAKINFICQQAPNVDMWFFLFLKSVTFPFFEFKNKFHLIVGSFSELNLFRFRLCGHVFRLLHWRSHQEHPWSVLENPATSTWVFLKKKKIPESLKIQARTRFATHILSLMHSNLEYNAKAFFGKMASTHTMCFSKNKIVF